MINQESQTKKFSKGDILVSDRFKNCSNVPFIFRTHRVDESYGVVYYKFNGIEDTIGYSYVRKANLLEKIFGWLKN
jgi:hypothetical protein